MPPSTHTYMSEQTKIQSESQSKEKLSFRVGDIVSLDLEKYERKIKSIKIRTRSELDIFEWSKRGYANNNYWIPLSAENVSRIEESNVSREEFIEKYEVPGLPVVINGCTKGWPAEVKWNRETLLKKFEDYRFKVGEDDNGDPVRMAFKYYLYYLENEAIKDDSPLYIFDSSFGKLKRSTQPQQAAKTNLKVSPINYSLDLSEDPTENQNKSEESKKKQPSFHRPCLLKDYKVPKYFDDDLFRLTGEKRRPPYRWFVLGGERSGTGIHFDPLGTSAWNTLLVGHKRWCLFPPFTPRKIIDPKLKGLDHEAVSWFTHVYPMLVSVEKDQDKSYAEEFEMVQVLQKPGETMYVPGGWHHVVMNLDFTIAVTQNFCSPTSIEHVWLRTRNSRPKLAQKLLNSSSFVDEYELEVSETQSETDGSDGECLCYTCKMKRKRKEKLDKQNEEAEKQMRKEYKRRERKEFERLNQEQQNNRVTKGKEKGKRYNDRMINEEVKKKKRKKEE
ncbi:20452_t:CDS:2 [Funneliformis geosporum]|uniref:3140_t:CDS:1 n=1 Tax=Funneliformis geosporum TaxID=1117311 RepID=A0A9W4SID9_9GLOM|nr:3140_t:CDS:2 [Funneliformis geosporum]CAI2169840.1 20452_t:CDS:2 [Funneliformis geosporum]